MLDARPSPVAAAVRIALVYGVLAALWIAFSDRALVAAVSDPETLTQLQTWKGWAFVAWSGVLIFALVHREVRAGTESERRFQSVVEQSLVGVYVIRGGRFVYVNPHLAELFGYTVDEVLELPAGELVAPDEREEVEESLRKREALDTPSVRYEFTGLRKDGEELVVEVHGRRIELGGAPAVLGVLVDRTQARFFQEQMQQTQRMEAVGQLTGAVAHDFNNLLTAIITPLELALRDTGTDESLRAELREIRETALRAAALTRKLLAFSRKQVDQPRVVDLNDAVGPMRHMLASLLPAGIRLEMELGDLPGTVRVDPSSLEQILLNLAVNGAEAMPSGGVLTVTTEPVTLSPEEASGHRGPAGDPLEPGPYLSLSVTDTGKGLDEDIRQRIFEPFFTTKERGTGLGLATVFGQAKRAGGEVLVESEPERGTTFTVLLPELREEPQPREARAERDTDRVGGGRILVVEDDAQVGRVVTEALGRFGFDASLAGTCADAVQAAGAIPALDLVLTDLVLPDGTGLDVARRVSQSRGEIRILFMSGYSDDEMMGRTGGSRGPGMTFLEKPFSLTELRAKVEESLAGPTWEAEGRSA